MWHIMGAYKGTRANLGNQLAYNKVKHVVLS